MHREGDPRPGTRTRTGSAVPPLGRAVLGWLAAAVLLGPLLAGLAPLAQAITGGGITGGGITAVELLSDPLEVAEPGWYSGGVASINMFLWAGAVALFLLHELVLPHFGVPEVVSYLGYAVAAVVVLATLVGAVALLLFPSLIVVRGLRHGAGEHGTKQLRTEQHTPVR